MRKEITSSSNPYIKELVRLKSTKERKEKNLFIVEGEDLIDFCYANKMLKEILTTDYSDKYDVDQVKVPSFILEKISSNKSVPSIMGVAFFKNDEKDTGNAVVYLDGVQDPGNVGTIIRTALAFSYDSVILSPECASRYNEKTIVSSKGAIFAMNVRDDITLKDLKSRGYQIISSALNNSVDYKNVELNVRFVLVLGNEGQGISKETFSLSDKIVKIDIANIDSLNVAVAGAILMNEYRKG